MDKIDKIISIIKEEGGMTTCSTAGKPGFSNAAMTRLNSVTTGSIYQAVINKERRGSYNGGTVQVIPHITGEIRERIHRVAAKKKYYQKKLTINLSKD